MPLRRTIRLGHATAMVAGTIIGASIFVQPSEITGQVPTIAGVLLVWVAAGVLTLFGALACAELASAYPRTGGVYVFLRETYGRPAGFLWGWAMFWSMHTGIIAAIGMVFGRYLAALVPLSDAGIRAVAIAAVVALSAVNYIGVRHGSTLQALFTAGKVLAIVLLVALAFSLGGALPEHFVGTGDAGGVPASAFLLGVAAGLFAFGGWHMVTYAAGETVDPARTIPRALLVGVALVTVCYVALNAAYLYVLPLDAVRSSTRVAADAAAVLVGDAGATAVSALVVFSTFGALAGIVLAGPRVYYVMARDGLLFRWLAELHPRHRTPHRAIALQAVWAAVLIATGSYRALFTRVIYTEWLFFAAMAAGIFLLRRRAGYSPAYRVWGHPFTTGAFVLASLAVVVNQVAAEPGNSLVGLLIVAAGLPVFSLWVRPAAVRAAATTADD